MTYYRKKAVVVQAMRYGKDEDGSWYPGAVQRIAQFMLDKPEDFQLTNGQVADVVEPSGTWDPPKDADLYIVDRFGNKTWAPLSPGDWVIKGVDGDFGPCKADAFEATWEKIGD